MTGVQEQNISNLLNGIALFIDDEVNDQDKDAYKLKIQIENRHIPLITYTDIPDDIEAFIANLHGVSFIILDWDLSVLASDDKINGVKASSAQEDSIKNIIEFLQLLLNKTYCPIFIFSQESINGIINELDQNKITQSGFHPRILFEPKQKIISDGALFSEIQNWLKNNPIITVLKTWEKAAQSSKFKMFSTLEQKNTNWPKILWDTFESDHTDQSHELTQTLTNIFANHVILECKFNSSLIYDSQSDITLQTVVQGETDTELIQSTGEQPQGQTVSPTTTTNNREQQPSLNDIRSVLEFERFINIDTNAKPAPGDLFKEVIENGEREIYWLNIRAQCNLLHINDPDLYCIKGEELDESRIYKKGQEENSNEKDVQFNQGQLHSRDDIIFIPFVINGKILEFDLKKFKIKKYNSTFQNARIGRILPPYITRIQQLFSAYMIREGLPAIPEAAINLINNRI